MKQRIFLYLFIFAAIIAIFQFVNSKKILDAKDEKIVALQQELEEYEAASDSLINQNLDLQYFSFLKNDKAMSYFENRGYIAAEIANAVEENIIAQNLKEGGNPLVPFEGMYGQMNINKVKILNHKWVVADFTDGNYWGEIFLVYQIDEENNIIFNVEKAFFYPPN